MIKIATVDILFSDLKDVGDDFKERLSKNQGQDKPGLIKAGQGLFSSSASPMQFHENLLLLPLLYLTWPNDD